MFASIRFAARSVATRRQFSNIPSGATAADAAAASIAAASLLQKDTSRRGGKGKAPHAAHPTSATGTAPTDADSVTTAPAGAMSHGQRRELNDMVSRVAGASATAAMYDAAPDVQRMNLNENSMRIVIGALAKLGRVDDVVCCVTECLFQGNVGDEESIAHAVKALRWTQLSYRADNFLPMMLTSSGEFPSESRIAWVWAVMRALQVSATPRIIQSVMDDLIVTFDDPDKAIALYNDHYKKWDSVPAGLLHSLLRAHAAKRDINSVVKVYGEFFSRNLTPSSETDSLLVRALLPHPEMLDTAFKTYNRVFATSESTASDAQMLGVMVRIIEACGLLPRDRAEQELEAILKFTKVLTEQEYVAAINVCRAHGFAERELALWAAKHSLARHSFARHQQSQQHHQQQRNNRR